MPIEISDWNDLDNVRNDLTADYVLVNDLDSDTAGYTGIGDDFEPIGFVSGDRNGDPFSGVLDGDGFQISDLVIEENDSSEGGVAFITQVGNGGLVENLSVDGTVNSTIGNSDYGGLAASVARDGTGTIQNCVSHVDVTALDGVQVGGLVGRSDDTVTDSYATGSVDGDDQVGGLVGRNLNTVTDSYATGSVDGNDRVGGLVGDNDGPVTDSYATGSVEGDSVVGGLVGRNRDTVTDSYATGSVEGDSEVAGLVGQNLNTVTDSYAVGLVTGNTNVGALVGQNEFNDELSDSYADEETTGQTDLTGDGLGSITNSYTLTTSEMQGDEASNDGNMDGFDYTNVWDEVLEEDDDTTADGYPILIALDRENQLDAQGILPPIFTAFVQVNGVSKAVTDAFVQINGQAVDASTAFTQVNDDVREI